MLEQIAYGLFLIVAMVFLTWLDALIPLVIFTIWMAAAIDEIGLDWYPLSGALFSAVLGWKLWKTWWA